MSDPIRSIPASDQRFTADQFAAFWASPDPGMVVHAVVPDVVGYWPGRAEPVRGAQAYADAIASVLAMIPDIRLEVLESAVDGDLLFIRWRGRGTGRKGPFEMGGIDRIRLRDGRVAENVIVFDTGEFAARSGHPWPRT
jgi:SnoaL-like domain